MPPPHWQLVASNFTNRSWNSTTEANYYFDRSFKKMFVIIMRIIRTHTRKKTHAKKREDITSQREAELSSLLLPPLRRRKTRREGSFTPPRLSSAAKEESPEES